MFIIAVAETKYNGKTFTRYGIILVSVDKTYLLIYNYLMKNDEKIILRNNRESYEKVQKGNLDFFHINSTISKDLFPIDVGYELHSEKKVFPNKYPYYLLHFVKRGKGAIEFDGTRTEMTRNTLFILPSEKDIHYFAEKNWEYYWINFNGIAAKNILNRLGFSPEQYFLRFPDSSPLHYFKEALAAKGSKRSQVFTVTHCLYAIFATIAEKSLPQSQMHESGELFEQIYDYIHEHLFEVSLSAGEIARRFFVSPCYFSTLFKKNINTNFKEYVNYERIKKATELLESTDLSVKQIAEAVGFQDALYFSKVFKRYRLLSPVEYRLTKRIP